MSESRTTKLLSVLLAIVIVLMVAIAGLFLRMLQLQEAVLNILVPFQTAMLEQNAKETGLAVGEIAPTFTLLDINGEAVSLDNYANQTILLGFSSLQCPACKQMYPYLHAVAENIHDVQILLISQGTPDENSQLVNEQNFHFPVLGWDDTVAQDYHVPGTPFFYVIDAGGKITNYSFASTLAQLENLVGMKKEQ